MGEGGREVGERDKRMRGKKRETEREGLGRTISSLLANRLSYYPAV